MYISFHLMDLLNLPFSELAPFLMTSLLLDNLKRSSPSRVLLTIAPAYNLGTLPFTACPPEDKYNPGDAYAQSKLALVLFGLTLSERLKGNPALTYSKR